MKIVVYEGKDGYKHRALLRDSDPDHAAPQGIPQDPPDLNRIDWEEVKRELHNLLVERELITWEDVMKSQNGVSSSILDVLKRKVIMLYRLQDGG
jgi:hypothetical protein